MRRKIIKRIKKVVIKVGTSVLTKDFRFESHVIDSLASQIVKLLDKGIEVTVVSSGAIGAGMTLMKMRKRPSQMQALQALAAVGQRYLMQCYEDAFSRKGYSTAQVLLTWADLAEHARFLNARHTLGQIHKWKHVPIINENDTVATDEIRFGDNDHLSSLIAILLEADLLIILSSVDGLIKGGNDKDITKRIKIVEKIDSSLFSNVNDKKKMFSVGGMNAKLKSVKKCVDAGIPVVLANGRTPNILSKILKGEDVGTCFCSQAKKGTKNAWVSRFLAQLKKHV